jgi:hypothetical protein
MIDSNMPPIHDLIQMIISESPDSLIVVRRDLDNLPRIIFNNDPYNGDPVISEGAKDSLFEWEIVSEDSGWKYIVCAGHITHTFEVWLNVNPNYKGE